ncbi:MAG: lipopolysaccharide biosynthesis protein [Phycisphaerales bacterium]|nr:MAG: lipopolysaccharide biosynthesis protein [Phycisphaerales bacterium]
MRQSYRLIYNAIVGWVSRLVESGISFLLLPFLVHRLGTAGYGVFALALSVSAALDFVRVGVAAALTKYVSNYDAQGRHDDINRVIGTTCAFGIAVGSIGGASVIGLSGVLADAFNVAVAERAEFELAVKLMGVLIAVSFPMMPYLGLLLGFQRYDLMRISQTIVRALRAGLMVAWFLLCYPSVTALAIITLIFGAGLHSVWLAIAHRKWPWLRGSPRQFRWVTFRLLLGFSTMMILIQLTTLMTYHATLWIAAAMISVDFVTHVTVMITPVAFLVLLIHDVTMTVMPAASKYQALGDRSALADLLIRGTRYSFLISAALVVMFVPIMGPLLRLWMGPDFEILAQPMTLVVICAGLSASELCAHNILKGLGKAGPILWRGIASSVIGLAITAVAIKWYGATSWAISLGIATRCVISALLHNWMCIAAIRAPVCRFVWRSYAQPAIVLAPILAAGWLAGRELDLYGLATMGLAGVGAVLLFGLVFAALFLSSDEYDLIRGIWHSARSRLSQQS